jgi:hypothetical protein
MDELVLIWSRYFWAFDTAFHVMVTLVDEALDWARPDGVAEGQSAATAGPPNVITAVATQSATNRRTSVRMGSPPGKMCDRSDKSG